MRPGDRITTLDEINAIPLFAVVAPEDEREPVAAIVRWPTGFVVDGAAPYWPDERLVSLCPLVVLALPGVFPRPERVVQAEALTEAAAAWRAAEDLEHFGPFAKGTPSTDAWLTARVETL